jgi:hypothetical protein
MAGVGCIAAPKVLGFRGAEGAVGGFAQEREFLGIEFAEVARFLVKHQRAIADPANLLNEVADLLKHLAQFSVTALNQNHFVPRVVSLADLSDAGGCRADFRSSRAAAFDCDSGAENVELAFGGLTGHFHEVGFLHAGRGAGEPVGELAVVGHKQKAFAHVVEAAYGVQTLLELVKELHDSGATLGILDRSDEALWFVQDEVTEALGAVQQFAVDADMVAASIGFGAKLGHCLAIHLDAALLDHLLGFSAAGYAGLGEDLLEPFQLGRGTGRRTSFGIRVTPQLIFRFGSVSRLIFQLVFGLRPQAGGGLSLELVIQLGSRGGSRLDHSVGVAFDFCFGESLHFGAFDFGCCCRDGSRLEGNHRLAIGLVADGVC